MAVIYESVTYNTEILYKNVWLLRRCNVTRELDVIDAETGCIAGVTGNDTTSCKDGKIWGVLILSSFTAFDENIWGVFNVSREDFSSLAECTSVSTDVEDNGITPDEQDAVLNLFRANAASNGFEEATVDDDCGVVSTIESGPLDAFWILEAKYK